MRGTAFLAGLVAATFAVACCAQAAEEPLPEEPAAQAESTQGIDFTIRGRHFKTIVVESASVGPKGFSATINGKEIELTSKQLLDAFNKKASLPRLLDLRPPSAAQAED